MQAIKRIMRYFKGTTDYGVVYPKPNDEGKKLIGYHVSNWCVDRIERS